MYNSIYNKKISLCFLAILLSVTIYFPSKTDSTVNQIKLLDNQIMALQAQYEQTPASLIVDGYVRKELLRAQIQSLESAREKLAHASQSTRPSLWQNFKNKLHAMYCVFFSNKKDAYINQKNHDSLTNQNPVNRNSHQVSPHIFPNKMGETTIKRNGKAIYITQLQTAPQRDGVSCGAHAMRSAEILYNYLIEPTSPSYLNTDLNNANQAHSFIKKWFTHPGMLLGDGVEKIRDRLEFNESQISVWDSPAITELSHILDMNISKSKPHVFVVNSASQSSYKNAGHWITIAFNGNNQLIVADSCNQSRIHGDSRVEAVITFLWP